MSERETYKVDANKVKNGDLMAVMYYVKVKSVSTTKDTLMVEDLEHGLQEIQVRGKDLIANCLSADQYEKEEKVSKTKAAELLVSSHNRPLTVCFEKQDGTERTLRGRLVAPEPLLGRSKVEDLDKKDMKDRMRLVDHRTLKWLVVDCVKYVVNSK